MQSTSSRSSIPLNRSNEVSTLINSTSTNSSTNSSTSFLFGREKDKYLENFNFPFCDDASKYERVTKIGQGTFG